MNKAEFLNLLGLLPEHCTIEARVLDRVECEQYFRETVEYAVEADERIKAFILIPKELKAPAPVVFCHHQHAGQFHLGKSEVVGLAGDPDQAYAHELAERGYVVIAPDAIAFEERNWTLPKGDAEYFELATRIVQGKTLLAKVLHDVSVALDYMQSLSYADADRIGFIGHSYGGRMAIWAPVFDERIKVSVSNCGCINYKDSIIRETGVQPEFCVPDVMKYGDIEDVVRLIAPRAIRIQATENDKWSRGAREIFDYAKSAFADGQIELKVWPGVHQFTPQMREEAYEFLARHLEV